MADLDKMTPLQRANEISRTLAPYQKQTTPTVQTTVATPPTTYDPTAQINALKEAQKAQSIASLSAKRDTALSSLNAEKAKITPMYYDKRNQTSTASQMQAKNFGEYMANRGLTNSGTNAQAELTRNSTLQGNIGALNRQELEANQDIQRRISDVNSTFGSDLASAQAGIEANSMDRLISAQQQAYQNALNQYNTDRGFNYQVGRDTIGDNRYNTQYADSRADVAYNRNYQTGRDAIADSRYNTEYADNRADVNYNRNYQQSRDSVADNQWQSQFDYNKLSDSQQMALQQAQFDFQREQAQIDNTYRQGTFEHQKAMDASQLDLQRKQMEISQSKTSTSDLGSTAKGNNVTTMAWQSFSNALSNGGTATAAQWLESNKEDLKDAVGTTEYNRMIDTFAAIQQDNMRENRRNLNSSQY